MADISNPQAVRFANEKARVFADAMVTTYETARAFKAQWDANTLGTLIPSTTDVVADGSDVDGRQRVTGAKLNALYTAAGQMITWFETGTPSRIDQLRQIAVNGASRF